MYTWQEDVIEKNRVLVRASRRGGKTEAAVRWARWAGYRVLFVVQNDLQKQFIIDRFTTLFPEGLTRVMRDNVCYEDGRRIDVISANDMLSTRGRRVDAVVFDEVGQMTAAAVRNAILCAMENQDFSVFATYTWAGQNGVKVIEELRGMEYVTVDYLDLLADGAFTPAAIRNIKIDLGERVFSKEFGPFTRKQQKNSLFKHLLDAAF